MATQIDITGSYGITDGSIHILDEHGEVVMWDSAEWVEDPSLVYVIAEAVREALVDGTAEIRMRINRPYDALDEDGHAYPGDLTDHRDPDHAENGECADCADLQPTDDLPTGYRWLNERESERYGAHPQDMPDVIVVRRTVDSNGVRFTQGEADLARPVS